MRRLRLVLLVIAILPVATWAEDLRLPLTNGSVKFAVIGDTGTGDKNQLAIAKQLAAWRGKFPFAFVLMMGDNLYGGDATKDYEKKFEAPYQTLLAGGVKFYATLGNHDNPNERLYKAFNMNGERYYTFKPDKSSVRFFSLDSNYVADKQLEWLDKELAASGSDWKICFFHHPLYSSGETHGSAELQRRLLEPLFLKHGVNVVLSGHEHFYERIKPQKGVAYFTLGNSAKLRRGDLQKTDLTAKGFDQGYAFMLVEIAGDDFYFQTISDEGQTVDVGSVHRVGKTQPTRGRTSQPVQAGRPAAKPQ
jgi:3',5'-cyclic AMP phosphodiesterase CpdA